jgi:hypothetical protein
MAEIADVKRDDDQDGPADALNGAEGELSGWICGRKQSLLSFFRATICTSGHCS